jgi:prephenate dehydrogenase
MPTSAAWQRPRLGRIVIWGVGLLGGSLGMAWRQAGVAAEVLGVGRSAAELASARRLGAIDRFTRDPAEALCGADVVVLAMPADAVMDVAATYGPRVAPGTVVTDVASIKAPVVAAWEAHLAPGAFFVGGHPMAGKAVGGVANACADLCQGARWVLTPGERSSDDATALVADLARAVGATVVSMDPRVHDQRVAYSSHLPQLVSVALAGAVGRGEADLPGVLDLVAGGFRDTTRLADSAPEMWWPIVQGNRPALEKALADFRQQLAALEAAMAAGDREAFTALFYTAAAVRHQALAARAPGSGGEQPARSEPDRIEPARTEPARIEQAPMAPVRQR